MRFRYQVIFFGLVLTVFVSFILFFATQHNAVLFFPKGLIAQKEQRLMLSMIALMLLVVVPLYFLLFFTVFKYKASNHKTEYTPDKKAGIGLQIIWWAIPTILVIILSFINWQNTHELDPYQPISSATKPITIQVVALQWKWLFIYPEQGIATVNFVQFPVNTPINFELTADAPMSSFWIPQLGGQIYAMTGMSTQTHFIASQIGDFRGSDAEINGIGMAGMKFTARSSTENDFNSWIQSVKNTQSRLDLSAYEDLSKPSENNPATFYATTEENLYNKIMTKFMASSPSPKETMSEMSGMEQK